MTFNEHYYEVLDVFSDLFIFIFDELNKRFKPEIEAVRAQVRVCVSVLVSVSASVTATVTVTVSVWCRLVCVCVFCVRWM